MTDVDVFGNIIDAATVEQAAQDTLQAWLPAHLAHQERRIGMDPGTLEQPNSWPVLSDLDMEVQTQLPAVLIASPGTAGTPLVDRGVYRASWRLEVAVVLAAATEADARKLAGLYLAAVIGALVQNRTLGDAVENCRWVGPSEHAAGTVGHGRQRAIYATAFEIDVRDVVNQRQGTSAPPTDPYNPPAAPENPLTADITVTATDLEATP